MANITVSYSEIEQAAGGLGTGRDDVTHQLQAMQARIENLVTSGFVTDQASGKFNAAFAEYTISARSVIAKLTEIQSFLTQTAAAMREMDAQIAAKIN